MSTSDVEADIYEILSEAGGLTARELAKLLNKDKGSVNSALYTSPLFARTDDLRPIWFIVAEEGDDPGDVAFEEELAERPSLELREWQAEALAVWNENNRLGIVEAVTGAGKTRLAIAAIAQELDAGGKAAVIVPTIELCNQWVRELKHWFPGTSIGQLRSGQSTTLLDVDVLVAVANSASRYQLGLDDGLRGLLVADECHRYGSEKFRYALEDGFSSRLGISATRERSDGAEMTVLQPYFGDVVYAIGYREAIEAEVIADFKVATVGVPLTDWERNEYDRLTDEMGRARMNLINKFGVPAEPYEAFMRAVAQMMDGGLREGIAAGKYMKAVSARRSTIENAVGKSTAIGLLFEAIEDANRTLVFTSTIESAEATVAQIADAGISAEALHSGLSRIERADTFARFDSGETRVLVAPRVLDEGVDVPEADLAVILSASRKRRQMIQRMGRILRLKSDGRLARFVLVYVEDTLEDPAQGAHEVFFDEVLENATEHRDFSWDRDPSDLSDFLSPF